VIQKGFSKGRREVNHSEVKIENHFSEGTDLAKRKERNSQPNSRSVVNWFDSLTGDQTV
jgi:hypothetical protein